MNNNVDVDDDSKKHRQQAAATPCETKGVELLP